MDSKQLPRPTLLGLLTGPAGLRLTRRCDRGRAGSSRVTFLRGEDQAGDVH